MALNDYKFQYKRSLYLVKVSPDAAIRGGSNGLGTITTIWKLDANQSVISGPKGYQGRHSKAGLIRVIKAAGWDAHSWVQS